jgi:hypothetical protein
MISLQSNSKLIYATIVNLKKKFKLPINLLIRIVIYYAQYNFCYFIIFEVEFDIIYIYE